MKAARAVLLAQAFMLCACAPVVLPRQDSTLPSRAPEPVRPEAPEASRAPAAAKLPAVKPPPAESPEERVAALNRLLDEGQRYFRSGDWDRAGRAFKKAADRYPKSQKSLSDIRFSLEEVRAKIQKASDSLMEKGMLQYRQGDLNGAVTTWRKIQAFNPSHEPARRCIRTATSQIKNIENID